jgi:toxin ParE1/3/4
VNYTVIISEEAETDIRAIFEYIAFTLLSIQNATKQIARLEEGIESLSQLPNRFRKFDKEPWLSRGLRVLSVDNYCIFYIPDNDEGVVKILRVLYRGCNQEQRLKNQDMSK